jgi:hypothetical protein
MTPLRQRTIEEMHLRNYSKHSIAAYVSAVYRLANFYGRRPGRLSREQIRNFLVDLLEVKQLSWPYYQQVLAALRFFYRHGSAIASPPGKRPASTSRFLRTRCAIVLPRIYWKRAPTYA